MRLPPGQYPHHLSDPVRHHVCAGDLSRQCFEQRARGPKGPLVYLPAVVLVPQPAAENVPESRAEAEAQPQDPVSVEPARQGPAQAAGLARPGPAPPGSPVHQHQIHRRQVDRSARAPGRDRRGGRHQIAGPGPPGSGAGFRRGVRPPEAVQRGRQEAVLGHKGELVLHLGGPDFLSPGPEWGG